MTLFRLTLRREQAGSLTRIGNRSTLENEQMTPREVKTKLLYRLFDVLSRAKAKWIQACRPYKKYFDMKVNRTKWFKPRDWILSNQASRKRLELKTKDVAVQHFDKEKAKKGRTAYGRFFS